MCGVAVGGALGGSLFGSRWVREEQTNTDVAARHTGQRTHTITSTATTSANRSSGGAGTPGQA